MPTWDLTEVNVHTSVSASMPNSRPNMSVEVEKDFCDISARRKYAAYKYSQDSGNTIKSLNFYLVLGTSVSSLAFTLPNCTYRVILLRTLISCCTWGSNRVFCDPKQCTAWVPHRAGSSMGYEHTLVAMCKHTKIRAKKDTGWHVGILDCLLSQRKLKKKWIKHQRWPTAKRSFFDLDIWKQILSREMLHQKHSAKNRGAICYFSVQVPPCSCFLSPLQRGMNTLPSSSYDTWSAAYLRKKRKHNTSHFSLYKYCPCWNVSWKSIPILWLPASCNLHRCFFVCTEESDVGNSNECPPFTGPELYDRALLRDLRGSIEVSKADTSQICRKANQNVPYTVQIGEVKWGPDLTKCFVTDPAEKC